MQLVTNCMENSPKKIISEALTYDDVLLVPGYSNILPRDVKISSKLGYGTTFEFKLPILK